MKLTLMFLEKVTELIIYMLQNKLFHQMYLLYELFVQVCYSVKRTTTPRDVER